MEKVSICANPITAKEAIFPINLRELKIGGKYTIKMVYTHIHRLKHFDSGEYDSNTRNVFILARNRLR